MIVVYHNNSRIIKTEATDGTTIDIEGTMPVAYELMQLALRFQKSKLVWCHQDLEGEINLVTIPEILHHQKMMVSYNSEKANYFGSTIGYVEESPFINVNKKVSYPTWQMSSAVGAVEATVLLAFKDKIKCDTDFDYFLNSVAKVGMPLGLLCYSEPRLLIRVPNINLPKATVFSLFKFVKQHYKTRWLFLLLLNLVIYESRFPFLAFTYALFFKNRNNLYISLKSISVQSNRSVVEQGTIDVIIPTIARKKYLYDVLKDLAQQTHLPKNVIIVEQNPQENSVSELDYLHAEKWPFTIKHTFTHQSGACNARNVALSQVESEWVFLNDDDNRFEPKLIEKVFENVKKYGAKSVTTSYLQLQEKLKFSIIHQSGIFGSGNSFVSCDLLPKISFDKSLEFGYGEDTDFGLQLRNLGVDIIYFPDPTILHLKAPFGGFRIKPVFLWSLDKVQPKPSPSIMYLKLKHSTNEQLLSYKLILFLRMLNEQSIFTLIPFMSSFIKKWKRSLYWAKQLSSN